MEQRKMGYENPTMEVIKFECADVVTISGNGIEGPSFDINDWG